MTKINLNIEADTTHELQTAVLNLAEFCRLSDPNATAATNPNPGPAYAQPEQAYQQPATPPAAAPTAVPVAPQSYSLEQLAVAATQLVDAGRRNDLVALLGQFGVQALTALPKEMYGAFATALRAMGAKI